MLVFSGALEQDALFRKDAQLAAVDLAQPRQWRLILAQGQGEEMGGV